MIRGEQTKFRDYACMGMDVEEFAIRTQLWHLIVPVEADPDDPPSSRTVPEAGGPLGPERRSGQNPEVAEHLELTLRRFVEAIGRERVG